VGVSFGSLCKANADEEAQSNCCMQTRYILRRQLMKCAVFTGTRKHLKHNKLRAFTSHIAVNQF